MTMKEWDANPNIIWKAAVQHYPLWFVSGAAPKPGIDNIFLPLLREHNFDFHINGHEHLFAYSYLDNKTPLAENNPKQAKQSDTTCGNDSESWFGDESHPRTFTMK